MWTNHSKELWKSKILNLARLVVGPQFFDKVVSDSFYLHSVIIFLGCVFSS